jgi:hypothetical protein
MFQPFSRLLKEHREIPMATSSKPAFLLQLMPSTKAIAAADERSFRSWLLSLSRSSALNTLNFLLILRL